MKDEQKSLNNLVNSSGYPFQLAIEEEIERTWQSHRWSIISREHPWRNKEDDSEGFIDLIIGAGTVRMVIECKRLRGGTWIFPVYQERQKDVYKFKSCWTYRESNKDVIVGWGELGMDPKSPQSDFCIIHGQDEKAKPLLERIGGLLIRSVEPYGSEDIQAEGDIKLDRLSFVIPCIITSAKLKTCNLSPDQISLENGTVKDPEFLDVPYIRFRKSLSFQEIQWSRYKGLKEAVRESERSIFIINSLHLSEFLDRCELEDIEIFEQPWKSIQK